MSMIRQRWLYFSVLAIIMFAAMYVRGAGLYRGVAHGVSYHSDAAKQVQALGNFLDGKYIWYRGLRVYDGYPYFLNHFDEWIIRPTRSIGRHVADFFSLSSDTKGPSTSDLFYWTLTLRWLYGVLVVVMSGIISRLLKYGFWPTAAVMSLVALSPVNIAVSHFATGDIACDLFFAAAVCCLTKYAVCGRTIWLAASGLLVGWAFAGKYNGGAAALFIAIYAGLACSAGVDRLRRFMSMGAVSGLTFVLGVLVAKPEFFWAPKRTWSDMWRVVRYARDYRAPEDFLAAPLAERLTWAWAHNAWDVASALGVLGLFAAALGLIISVKQWRRQLLQVPVNSESLAFASLKVSLFFFPWLVLITSLSTKLNLHHFYFSWIYPALALSSVYALLVINDFLQKWTHVPHRPLMAAAAVLLISETASRMPAELYFWQREDIRTLARYQVRYAPLRGTSELRDREVRRPESVLRSYLLEGPNVSTFRNRPRSVAAPDAQAWRSMGMVPLPQIPFGAPVTDWIILDGPVLPRNDRLFRVEQGRPFEVVLVSHEPLSQLRVGIMSGIYPAFVSGRIAGQRFEDHLESNDWIIHRVENPKVYRTFKDESRSSKTIYHYRLQLKSRVGAAWLTVLTETDEEQAFRYFVGDESADIASMAESISFLKLGELMSRFAYRTGNGFSNGTLSNLSTGSLHLWSKEDVLPAGPYKLELSAVSLSGDAVIAIELDDSADRSERLMTRQVFPLHGGINEIEYRFSKPFAPYQNALRIELVNGDVLIGNWSLSPNVEEISASWSDDERPPWQRRYPPAPETGKTALLGVTFGGVLKVEEVGWPDPIVPGTRQAFFARISLLDEIRHFNEYDVFIHFYGADGSLFLSSHIRAEQFRFSAEDPHSVWFDIPNDMKEQKGYLVVGVWNRRTERRLSISDSPESASVYRRNRALAGSVYVVRQ